MNKLPGHISTIETEGDLSIVTIALQQNIQLKVIVIETPDSADYMKVGQPVSTLFKETEVILSLQPDPGISIENRIPCTISHIEGGRLLSRVELSFGNVQLVSLLSAAAVKKLQLKAGQDILALIKFNEIMLAAI